MRRSSILPDSNNASEIINIHREGGVVTNQQIINQVEDEEEDEDDQNQEDNEDAGEVNEDQYNASLNTTSQYKEEEEDEHDHHNSDEEVDHQLDSLPQHIDILQPLSSNR